MRAMIHRFRQRYFPPIPAAIREDFTLLGAEQLQSQIPLLYLTLFLTVPTAVYASNENAHPFIRYVIPAIMGTACLTRFLFLVNKRNRPITLERARKMITVSIVVSGALGAMCSVWCVMSWWTAPPALQIYYPMIMAMGSLATAYCLCTIRLATILNLVVGLLPITLLLFLSGDRMNVAAATSLTVACGFLVRMILQQHGQRVDLLLLQRKMQELANTDPLTGLPNRRALSQRLEEEISAAGQETQFALALLDLNGFKPVNDRYGHGVGDLLLCEVANRLRKACGDQAIAARLGGDEFAILVPTESTFNAHVFADQMIATLVPPCEIAGHPIRVGASIGVAHWPGDGTTSEALFETADKALYAAKAELADIPHQSSKAA